MGRHSKKKSSSTTKHRTIKMVREPQVDFSKLRRLEEIGNKPEEKYSIIAIGYPYDTSQGFACPGSQNAMRAINDHPEWSQADKHLFITIPFGKSGPLKRYLGYNGTMPIVFYNVGEDFIHVGGGDDLIRFAQVNKEPSLSTKQSSYKDDSDDEFL